MKNKQNNGNITPRVKKSGGFFKNMSNSVLAPASPINYSKKDRGLDKFIMNDLAQKEQEMQNQPKGNYAMMKRLLYLSNIRILNKNY